MAVIKPKKEIIVADYNDFCRKLRFKKNRIAGVNGTDEELIEEVLSKVPSQKWLINFIEDGRDGFFKLQLIN